jgi:predicted MFS family arabinose efflux permease
MSIIQIIGFLILMVVVTVTLVFLWNIWYLTFPHWKWREDHFGRKIMEKLSPLEKARLKKYRVSFFICLALALGLFILFSFLNEGSFI